MTSASNPGNYVDFDEYIGLKLEKTRSTIRTTDVLTALAGIAAVFLSYLLVFVIFDQWVLTEGFSPFWRWVLLGALVLSTVAWLVVKVAMPSVRSVNGLFAAREIEKAEPGLKSNLLNLVDLKSAGRTINPTILKALERQAALKLQKVDVGQSVDHRPLIRTAYALLVVIVVFCFYAMLSPKKISNSIWRGLMPGSRVGVATITEILDVKPGDLTIPAHQPSVEVQVDIAGEIPPHVTLLYTTSDGKQDQPVELHVDQEGQTRYRGQLIGEGSQGLIHDITYFIRAGDATSRPFKITVEQPPYADVEMVRIEHPGYMKIAPFDQPNNPGIDAWEGAKVIVSAKANMPLRSAKIQFLDDAQSGPNGEEELMSISGGGRQLQAAWTLKRRADGTQPKLYRVDCRTDDDRVTLGHVNYPINIKLDLPPEVVLVYPDRDLSVAANATVPLAIQARDPDFELSYIYLNVEKSGQKIFREQLSEGRQQKLTIKSELPMTRLNPAVGDTFEIWVEAFDNKQPTPNSRATQKVKISILPPMTPKEADRELAEQKNQIEDKIAEADKNLNQEQRDAAQQPDDGDQKRENPNEVAAKDNDQQQDPNPQDQNPQDQNPQDGDQQQTGKGKSGNPKPGENSNTNEERGQGKDGEPNQKRDSSGKQGDEKQSLKSDGSQDDEAMRRINQSLNEKKSSKPKDSNESEGQEQKSGDQKGEQKKPTNDPNQAGADEKKPSEDQAGDQNKLNDPKATGDRKKQDEKAAGKQPKSDPSKDDQQSQQSSDTPKNQTENGDEKGSPAENQSNQKSSDSQKGTKQQKQSDSKTNDSSPDASAADGKDRQEQDPEKNSDETKQGSKSDPKQNQKGSSKDPAKNDQKQGQDAGQSDQSDGQSQQNDGDQKDAQSEQGGDNQKPSDDKSGKAKPDKNKPKQDQGASEDSDDSDSETTGEKKQTDDSKKSKKGKADGTEEGTAKPDRDPNSKPERTKNDKVKRDPKEKPEIRPNSESSDSDNETEQSADQAEQGSKEQKSKPKQGKKGADRDQPDSDSSQEKKSGKPDKSQSNSDQADEVSEKPSGPGDSASEKSDDKSGSESDQSGEGKGDKSDASKKNGESGDQKSDSKSQKGQLSKSNDKGDGKEAKENAGGDKGQEKGQPKDQQKGDAQQKGQKDSKGEQKPGEKGSDKKSDSKGGQKSDQKSDNGGDQSGQKGEDGQSGQSGADGKGGKTGDKPTKSDGQGKPTGTGGTNAERGDGAEGAGEGSSSPQGDDPNLEYNRQATELILDKIKQDLERGDLDPELLEQLGWTEKELKQFSERMTKSLNESKRGGDTPESQARQLQFQEMLKNLDLQKTGSQRSGEKEPKRDVQQIGPKSTPLPPAYKNAFNKFTKDRARQKPSADQPKK